MEKRKYTCQYCKNKFVPKRRKVQKYCRASCRVSDHRLKKMGLSIKSNAIQLKVEENEPSTIKVDQISVAGVANSAIGAGVVELAKNIFTSEEKKPATKGDISKLAAHLKRYHRIKNLSPNLMGNFPYFDLDKGEVVYLKLSL